MILLAILIQTLSFYMFYNTSRRARLSRDPFSALFQRDRRLTLVAAWVLLIASFAVFVTAQGLGVGIFAASISLMTVASLVILFVPMMLKKS